MEEQLKRMYGILSVTNDVLVEENGLRKQKELKHINTTGVKGKTGVFFRALFTAAVIFINLFNFTLVSSGEESIVLAVIMCVLSVYALFTFLKPRKEKNKKRDKRVNIILAIVAVFAVYVFARGFSHSPAGIILILVGTVAVAALFTFFYIKKDQKTVNTANEDIRANNEEIDARRNQLNAEYNELAKMLREEVENGYPEDYTNLDAVDFFWGAYRNGRASTYGELINLYEDELFKRKQEQEMKAIKAGQKAMQMTQQEILKQQKLNNMFAVMNGVQLMQISNQQAQVMAQNAETNRKLDIHNQLHTDLNFALGVGDGVYRR